DHRPRLHWQHGCSAVRHGHPGPYTLRRKTMSIVSSTARPLSGASATAATHSTHSAKKFPGHVKDAGWNAGLGIGPSYVGIFVNALVNPLTKTSARMRLDRK